MWFASSSTLHYRFTFRIEVKTERKQNKELADLRRYFRGFSDLENLEIYIISIYISICIDQNGSVGADYLRPRKTSSQAESTPVQIIEYR